MTSSRCRNVLYEAENYALPYAVTKVLHQQALLSLAVSAKNCDRADHDSGHGRGHTEHMREISQTPISNALVLWAGS